MGSRRKNGVKQPAEAAMAPEACKRIREAMGLTQEQFAEQLGVRVLTISLWETGKTVISKSRALSIQGLQARGAV